MCQVQKILKEKLLNLEISDQINYIFKCFLTVTTHQFLICFVRGLNKFSNTVKIFIEYALVIIYKYLPIDYKPETVWKENCFLMWKDGKLNYRNQTTC